MIDVHVATISLMRLNILNAQTARKTIIINVLKSLLSIPYWALENSSGDARNALDARIAYQ